MICHAVIDTNVLVSALLSSREDSATVQVIGKVIRGEIIPVYSNAITKEYREVLLRKKFGFSDDAVSYLLSAFEKFGILFDPDPSGIVLPDRKDLPFYEVVLGKQNTKKEFNKYYEKEIFHRSVHRNCARPLSERLRCGQAGPRRTGAIGNIPDRR